MTIEAVVAAWQAVVEAGIRWIPVLILAALIVRFLRMRSARERHAVWVIALAALPLMPVATAHLNVGSVEVPSLLTSVLPPAPAREGLEPASRVPSSRPTPDVAEGGRPRTDIGSGVSPTSDGPITQSVEAHSVERGGLNPWEIYLSIAWATIALLLLTWELRALGTARILTRDARAVRPEDLPAALSSGARDPEILSGGTGIPLLFGVIRPRILLPSDWQSWPETWLRAVLLHERAHAMRRDIVVLTLARLVRAVFWFHPGTWLGVRELKREAELATDEHVLETGMDRFDYADALLGLARYVGGRRVPVTGIPMAAPERLQKRLVRVARTDSRQLRRHRKATTAATIGAVILASAAVAAPAIQPAPVEWLERIQLDGGSALWQSTCPTADTDCAQFTAHATRLLGEMEGGGIAAIQEVSTGRIAAYVFIDREGSRPAVPAVPVSAVAGLPLAAAWWEAGMGDRRLPCPAVINLPRTGSFANPNGLDTGMIRAPVDVLAIECATAAIAMAWYIDEEVGSSHLQEQFARWGFAPGLSDTFWLSPALPKPDLPTFTPDPRSTEEAWLLAGSSHGSVQTTPLHVIRFLQAAANGGRMISPVPPVADISGTSDIYMSSTTANSVLQALSVAETLQDTVPGGDRLVGITGATPPSAGGDEGEMFAGLLMDASEPRYAVAVWLPHLTPTEGGSPNAQASSRRLAHQLLTPTR